MPWPFGEVLPALEEFGGRAFALADLLLEMVGEAAGELEHRLGRRLVVDQRGIASPAYLDAGEQIGLGARQPVQPRRLERRILAENLGSGVKVTVVPRRFGVGPSLTRAPRSGRPREGLAEQLLVARDLDDRLARQRVDHADADAVQAARGRIGLVRELAARMEHGQDHLERRLARIFRDARRSGCRGRCR